MSPPGRLVLRSACDGGTRVANVSYRLAIVALGVLLEPELTEQISSIGSGSLLPTPSRRASTDRHSSESDSSEVLEEKSEHLVLRVDMRRKRRNSGGACVSFLLFFCAVRLFLCGADSGVLPAQLH